ncbi:MAG: prolipoprotein diacylglyceryl transferase [Gemmatimonadetes bacterium]|nr:prolipoprotein diacylglyceryl transferase [Gemmatimonadota bacterium]
MYPEILRIGGFAVTSFGVMMFASFLAGAWVLSRQLERQGRSPELAWEVLVWVAIAGILGAKLYYLGLHWRDLVADPLGELTNRGGLVWYGGLIGGVSAYYWQMKRKKLPLAPLFDATAPALALAYAVGRLGCFLVGDDYGLPTTRWAGLRPLLDGAGGVGIAFPEGSPPSTAGYLRSVGADIPASVPDAAVVAVHPTQLYEIGAALIMFGILWKLSGQRLRAGRLFGAFLALYGIERFLVEFVRAKGDRIAFGLSTSQVASVLLLGVAGYLWSRRAGARAAAPAAQPAR